MSKYLEESYDASLKEIEQLKVKLEIAQKALELSVKHINGQGEIFSEREKIPVLYQLNQALDKLKE
jgi:hypothetical protein